MNKISITIVTQNNEKNIGNSLVSASWADEIVVLDLGSNDSTKEICKLYKAKIIDAVQDDKFSAKELAKKVASHEWVLCLNPNEIISEELKNKIKSLIDSDSRINYKIKVQNYFLGKVIKHCGWNNNFEARLFHKSLKIGTFSKLKQPIYRFANSSLNEHLDEMVKDCEIDAKYKFDKGFNSNLLLCFGKSFLAFFYFYFFKLGFLDGIAGLLLCVQLSYGVFYKNLKHWELIGNRNKL